MILEPPEGVQKVQAALNDRLGFRSFVPARSGLGGPKRVALHRPQPTCAYYSCPYSLGHFGG